MQSLPPVPPTEPAKSGKKKWLLAAVIMVVLLVLAGGYTFAVYLPNRPSAVYSTGLARTGKAVDTLLDYSSKQVQKHYKSYRFTGSLGLKSSAVSGDGKLSGSFNNDGSGTGQLSADILGQKLLVNIRSVRQPHVDTPDLYIQLSGIKSVLSQYGLSGLDGQWVSVDHTLLDTVASSYTDQSSEQGGTSFPTSSQIEDAARKVQAVNKQYLFTTDSSKAVLRQEKYIGAEQKDGRKTYHYTVGYDKTHLQAYIGAVKTALDSSSLNDWSKKANDGRSLSKIIDWDSLTDSVAQAKSDVTLDLWIDRGTKLVHTLQFKQSDGTVIVLTQHYTGGAEYPFTLSASGPDGDTGEQAKVTVGFTVDSDSGKVSGSFKLNEASTAVSLNFGVTPTDKKVEVTAPTGAQPITDLLSSLGLGDDLGGSSSTALQGDGSDPFTILQ